MATTRQQIQKLLDEVTDEDSSLTVTSATIEGKLVQVTRCGYGKQAWGKRSFLVKATVDGAEVHMHFSMRKTDALGYIFDMVSEQRKREIEESRKRSQEYSAKMQREQAEREEFIKPLREHAQRVIDHAWRDLHQAEGQTYVNSEIEDALKIAAHQFKAPPAGV